MSFNFRCKLEKVLHPRFNSCTGICPFVSNVEITLTQIINDKPYFHTTGPFTLGRYGYSTLRYNMSSFQQKGECLTCRKVFSKPEQPYSRTFYLTQTPRAIKQPNSTRGAHTKKLIFYIHMNFRSDSTMSYTEAQLPLTFNALQ
jgi:hypothetical protein